MIFWLIFLSAPLTTLLWWVAAHVVVGRGNGWGKERLAADAGKDNEAGKDGEAGKNGKAVAARERTWVYGLCAHTLIASFFGVMIGMFAWIILERAAGISAPPVWARTLALVWYIAALPASVAVFVTLWAGSFGLFQRKLRTPAVVATVPGVVGSTSERSERPAQGPAVGLGVIDDTGTSPPRKANGPDLLDAAAYSRRRFLATTALAAPPLLTAGFFTKSRFDQGHFRTRDHTVAIDNLPSELIGLTIAHVSDVHIGRYADSAVLKRIVDATNNLRCDMIAFTGDLIDFELTDLPEAISMLRKFDAPNGVVLCEGNHDLFVSASTFREDIRRAGIDLLVNERIVRRLRGVECEISGLRWGRAIPGSSDAHFEENFALLRREMGEESITAGSRSLAGRSTLPPLRLHLVHHPHAFDAAGDAGVDLTLAGHTHGGQLMLAERFGPASLLYKYVSGLYTRRNPSGKTVSCVVSNGTGNWLPLRLAAPAEISRITLVRA